MSSRKNPDARTGVAHTSQDRTAAMLDAIDWANRRIERFGLGNTVAILYSTEGTVRLVDRSGRTKDEVDCDYDGDLALAACSVLVARLELALRRVLYGDPRCPMAVKCLAGFPTCATCKAVSSG